MSHEPECGSPCCPWMPEPCSCSCICDVLRSAYQRGLTDQKGPTQDSD